MNTDEEAETNARKPEGISDSAQEAPKELGQNSRRRWQADSVVDLETGSVYHTPHSFSGVGDVEEQVVLAKGHTLKPKEDVAAPKPFGDIQDVTARKMLSEIGVRNYLAYAVVGVFLVCMLIYVIRMVVVNDPEGLTNAISILVGIVGLVMGYFFGTEEGRGKD